jgi:HEXXH motif-containing protein
MRTPAPSRISDSSDSVLNYELPVATLDDVLAGPASTESIGVLAASQYSLRRLRVLALLDRCSQSPECERAVETLLDVDHRRPDITANVLMHPPAGVWLVRALRSNTELGYLNSLAAAAAVQAGLPVEIDVPVHDGFACLPTVGAIPVTDATVTTIRGRPDGLVPAIRHQVEANGTSLNVHIEDSDPYREFGEPQPPQLLDAHQADAWRRQITDAWRLTTERHTAYAHELSTGLSTLVPIARSRRIAGASSRAAFGGLALSTKDDAAKLAEVLVHELQHSKLNAFLDLFPLVDDDSEARWHAPWRTDPRPLTGVLHGIYAFTSVVEFWHVEREHLADPDATRKAHLDFAYRRHQVREAIDNLDHADGLTKFGRRLIEAADLRITVCEKAEVPADIRREVARLTDKDRADWMRRNKSQLHGVGVTIRPD